MPSWGIHLAVANEVIKKIKINDVNCFLIGNFLPDAERHVINNFSIRREYDVSHFPQMEFHDGILDKLTGPDIFVEKYKSSLNNSLVLGYLTHLLTDYYWNKKAHTRFTICDKEGNFVGIRLKNGDKIICSKNIRMETKHNDFGNFENYLLKNNKFMIPKFEENILNSLTIIEETPYNKEDILKIIKYLENKVNKNEYEYSENKFKQYNEKLILEDYEESIKFIVNYLKKL